MDTDPILDNQSMQDVPPNFGQPEPKWKTIIKSKGFIFSVLGLGILILGVSLFFLMRKSPEAVPVSKSVVLLIKGPDQLTSGNEAEYHITYHNGESADLVNVSLDMLYPSGFKFKSSVPTGTSSSGRTFNLAVLKHGQDAEVVVRGKLEGSTGEDKLIKAILHYSLSNFNSQFAVEQTLRTGILPPNLTMDINGPVDVVNGQDTTFTVNFTNVTPLDFDNLAVQMTYPEGFSFTSASIPPSKDNNYWKLAKLASNSSASIDISGSFTGDTSEEKLVKADLGQLINNTFALQITSTATFRIIPSSLSLTLSSDHTDTVKLGDVINYTLKYNNQGNIGLNNIVIVVKLEGQALDLARLVAQDAIVNGSTLTWKAATLGSLALLSPNEKGEIRFSVPVKRTLNTNVKNQTINAAASISSDEISKPTKSGDLSLKLSSSLDLIVNGDYISGASPMQVGKSTLFNMTFLLSNLSNDASNAQVVASMPLPSSAWKNVIIPDSERSRLSFDPNSGKITWNLGNLPAFTGKYVPVAQVTFQLEVIPTEADRNRTINLLTKIQATATDNFTNQTMQTTLINSVSTGDIQDSALGNPTVQ